MVLDFAYYKSGSFGCSFITYLVPLSKEQKLSTPKYNELVGVDKNKFNFAMCLVILRDAVFRKS